MSYSATYSPEDNKLRLYSGGRLDSATYERVKKAGFIYDQNRSCLLHQCGRQGVRIY